MPNPYRPALDAIGAASERMDEGAGAAVAEARHVAVHVGGPSVPFEVPTLKSWHILSAGAMRANHIDRE